MTTFTNTVIAMHTLPQLEGQTNVVVNVIYLVVGVDGQYTANVIINEQFSYQQGNSFTPYNQLTEDQVIGWVNPQTISTAKENIQSQIDKMANPPITPTSQALPWAQTSV